MAGVFAAASARQGRRAAPGDAGPSAKRLDAPCRAEAAARRVAIRRPPEASERSTDVPHRSSRFSYRGGPPDRNENPSHGGNCGLSSSRALRRSADAPHRPSRRAYSKSRFAPSNRFHKAGTCSGSMAPHRPARLSCRGGPPDRNENPSHGGKCGLVARPTREPWRVLEIF